MTTPAKTSTTTTTVNPNSRRQGAVSPGQTMSQPPTQSQKPKPPTDDELRDRWLNQSPLTAYGSGEFRRYKDGIWSIYTLADVRREIDQILVKAKPAGIRPTSRLLNSVMELARVKIELPPEKWDADPDILICRNGTLHIPTQNLQSHSPISYATSMLDFDFDPHAKAGTWEFVLSTCIPDARDFVQEFAGLSLTTEQKWEIALWFFGPPGSGKSTIITGLRAAWGARAGLLSLSDIVKSRFSLTDLPGKTLVVSTEQPASYLEATDTLNRIISGEPITVDRKFRDQVTIIPRAKIIWAMNQLPRIGEADSGLFRRVKVVSFPKIPEANQNPEIKEMVKLEGPGILNWALDGLTRLQARGHFEIPACVTEATKQFKESNDIPAAFVADECLTGKDCKSSDPKTQGSKLYEYYRNWCFTNGHKPQSNTSVANDWRRLGFVKYSPTGISFWRGVELKNP